MEAKGRTVPERGLALGILGLAEGADAGEIRAAHQALRAHVEARAAASEDAGFRAARRAELDDLDRALEQLLAGDASPGRQQPDAAPPSRRAPRWLLAWAIVATVVALGLVVHLVWQREGFGPAVLVGGAGGGAGGEGGGYAIDGAAAEEESADDAGGTGEALDAGERARLVAHSSVEGAMLEVRTRGDKPEVVAQGAADDSVYWLAPGTYSLKVSHPDCRDYWQHDVEAHGGDELTFAPELCGDTAWLVVRSNVADDKLTIDGKPVGATGETQHPVRAGEHEVRVSKDGYRAWEGIVEAEPGRVLGVRPRLERVARAEPQAPRPKPPAAVGAAAESASDRSGQPFESWHEEARQWLLARYDLDRSGWLDSKEELDSIPCEQWLGLEQSHDQSGLGLSLTRFYGFDGKGWRSGALGVADQVRDLAYQRMKACGLR